MRKVLITGIGIIAPSGVGVGRFWDTLLSGANLFGRITRFDSTSFACRLAAQVDDAVVDDAIDARKQRTTSLATRLALVAANESLRDARLSLTDVAPESVGVCVGTALGGWVDGEQQYGVLLERGARRVNPFLVTGAGNHGPGVEVAGAIGAQGSQVTFSSGCPSGLQAIGHGAQLIASGMLDVCLGGGTETPLSPMVVAALSRTHELSVAEDPVLASRPFDARHNGMVLSEGSCFVVMESEEGAARRGARPYAEVLGSISSCDAQGMYGLDSDGRAGGRSIHRLLRACEITPAELDYVCAHANGSPVFDRKEALVLKIALGEFAAKIAVSSIKGVLGHPFGAAGAFQVAASALAMRHEVIPPTHHLEQPASDCDLHHVANTPRHTSVNTALVTSYGYGGVNSYVVLRRAA